MGNAIAKDNDTINWNNVKTDNFSENLGNKQLTNDSKLLISRLHLNIPTVNETESDNLSDIFNKYEIQPSAQNQNTGELSDTSPFISSDMYNYLLNKNQISSNGQKGGAKLDDDSSTSSTSSSESEESESDKKKNKKSKSESEKSESEKSESEKSESEKSESENNDSDLSYVSSPGNSDKSEKSESEEDSELSGGSISNNNEDLPPSSINTSDINMVSESS